MLFRHMLPGVCPHWLSGPLAYQQKPERERLSKGSRKEGIEIGSVVASRLRVGIENVPKLLSYLQQRVTRVVASVKFRQSIPHDPANEAGGMGH